MIDRIKTLVNAKARSVREFAELIGVKQVTLNQQVVGDRKLSLDVILAILNSFEDISAEWLLRGVGNMYKNAEASTDSEEEDSEEDKFYKDIIFTYQEMTKEYRKKIEYLEAELAKAAPFAGEEKKKQSKSA
jgi:plasmid maintenance system antidote protein VapI